MSAQYDVVVIGGGPAGSISAGFLAQNGCRVALFEKERFPRYHIGESLLSATMPILEALGVMPAVEAAGFIRKPGGTFIWGSDIEPWNFFFREDPGGRPSAFHVLRSEFDHVLLRHAASLGVAVREEHQVRDIRHAGGVNRIEVRDAAGADLTVEAPWVVDASGQSALLGRRDGLREFDPFFKNLAVFGYYEGAKRLDGPVEGNILSAAFAHGWFWFIPLHDGTTSVGAVIDAQTYAGQASGDPLALYLRLVDECEAIATRVSGARLVSPIRVIRD
jgi:halogenation protein CepH